MSTKWFSVCEEDDVFQAINTIVMNLGPTDVPTSTLFVGRIPYSMTKEELMELFPGSTSARIISDSVTGHSKGYVCMYIYTCACTH